MTKQELHQLNDNTFYENTNREITATKHNEFNSELIDSMVTEDEYDHTRIWSNNYPQFGTQLEARDEYLEAHKIGGDANEEAFMVTSDVSSGEFTVWSNGNATIERNGYGLTQLVIRNTYNGSNYQGANIVCTNNTDPFTDSLFFGRYPSNFYNPVIADTGAVMTNNTKLVLGTDNDTKEISFVVGDNAYSYNEKMKLKKDTFELGNETHIVKDGGESNTPYVVQQAQTLHITKEHHTIVGVDQGYAPLTIDFDNGDNCYEGQEFLLINIDNSNSITVQNIPLLNGNSSYTLAPMEALTLRFIGEPFKRFVIISSYKNI